jgi:hypothetical protein
MTEKLFPSQYKPKSKAKKQSPTNALQSAIIKYLNFQGANVMRINTQGTYNEKLGKFIKSGSTKGVSDILATYKGRSLAIEVKQGKDKLSPEQIEFRDKHIKAGGFYLECRSLDIFLQWIKEIESL